VEEVKTKEEIERALFNWEAVAASKELPADITRKAEYFASGLRWVLEK
jgi:hypothetical protein